MSDSLAYGRLHPELQPDLLLVDSKFSMLLAALFSSQLHHGLLVCRTLTDEANYELPLTYSPLVPVFTVSILFHRGVSGWRCGGAAGKRPQGAEDRATLIGGGHPENQWPHHWGERSPERWCICSYNVEPTLERTSFTPRIHVITGLGYEWMTVGK